MKTRDVYFAAYLKMKGYKVVDFILIDQHRAEFKFDITKEEYKKMKLEFVTSESSKIKQCMEVLKDLIH